MCKVLVIFFQARLGILKTSRDFEMLIRRLADSMTEKIKGQLKTRL